MTIGGNNSSPDAATGIAPFETAPLGTAPFGTATLGTATPAPVGAADKPAETGFAGGLREADEAGGFHAVHHGHLRIHQDEGVGLAAEGGEGFAAVDGEVGGVAEVAQLEERDLLVHGVVLGDEDAHAGGRGR